MRFDQLAKMAGGRLLTSELAAQQFCGVSVDSRTLEPEQLFFAIRGEHHDGHRFIDQALAGGAVGVVAAGGFFADRALPEKAAVIEVPDSHAAMLRLTEEYLKTLDVELIGITGSNGKTTTKEFTFQLLNAVRDGVYRSPGNYNNLFGIPLALFAMPGDTKVAVLELAISVPGEMARLASMVKPHLVAVINVGPTHLEFLGSVEAVAREKLEAMNFAQPDAPLIVNADDPVLLAEAERVRSNFITFGVENDADFKPDSVAATNDGHTVVTVEGYRFHLPSFGRYQVYNLLAAYAIVRTMGYSFGHAATEEIRLTTAGMRGEVVTAGEITFVSDCYNANPESVKEGLASFASYPNGKRRVAILGDMLELGEGAARYHSEIGASLKDYSFDLVLAVGPLTAHLIEAARAAGIAKGELMHFDDAAACADRIENLLQPSDLVYLKGSRGVGLEVILERFTAAGEEG